MDDWKKWYDLFEVLVELYLLDEDNFIVKPIPLPISFILSDSSK